MGEVAIDPAMPKNGLPQDRRLCTNGFIIRAQATIRTDGSSSVQGLPILATYRSTASQ
jgi:hypothetical protein